MVDSNKLLDDSQRLLKRLEADIRERLEDQPALDAQLKGEWQQAGEAKRTAATYFDWRDEAITQAGAHWILACVFLRFLEDNGYLDRPFLFGADAATQALARDRHEGYFRANPGHSDRDYLIACFHEAAKLPGLSGLYDPRHNPLFRLGVSGDGAIELLAFWRRIDPDSGQVIHGFADPNRATRFLGDLYQDLSESARKRYALLQTPVFVEEFILDRTLSPAIETFGYREVRLIDPACGSGHFLLGAFARLFDLWARNEPARNRPDLAQRALDGVYGVDLNPFAVEIARFRLLIAALTACDVDELRNAPDFRVNVAAGDSLLHGLRFGQLDLDAEAENLATQYGHAYVTEELEAVNRILGRQYHAVVGNPPYITPKDAALNELYRSRYRSCHMKYSLGVPFTERFFELAVAGNGAAPAGFVGMITTNSFMKREFGKKLIESFLPTVDLTHVIDASGAYIPGHGTPTVLLFGRHRGPVGETVRTVMGIKGEPSTPDDPAQGQVWRAIVVQVDRVGSESEFVSVADTPRATFSKHPWSIGGGGAAELKIVIEENAEARLETRVALRRYTVQIGDRLVTRETREMGFASITGEDEVFVITPDVCERYRVPCRRFGIGDEVRDWCHHSQSNVIFLYGVADGTLARLEPTAGSWLDHHFWRFRNTLRNRLMFGKTPEQAGLKWWSIFHLSPERVLAPQIIVLGEVATHNHFVLDRGGTVFKQTAPVIKLPAGASESEHLQLLGLLNSSVACFWLKQVCHNKGSTVDDRGARQRTAPFEDFYAFNSTKVAEFPLAADPPIGEPHQLDTLARGLADTLPTALLSREIPTRASLDAGRVHAERIRAEMIAVQEELDWLCYGSYGLTRDSLATSAPPPLKLGERAFEIVLARRMAAGDEQTTWFERHGSIPITELPSHWPWHYRHIVESRIALIESDRSVRLIERPEYKRRWNDEPWESQERRALRNWLLDRLEAERYWPRASTPKLRSANQLTDLVRTDADFMQVGALYTGRDDFDIATLVVELTESEALPYLPVLCYADEGLRKRAAWERTWALQRQEDAIDVRVAAATPKEAGESDDAYDKRLAAAQRAARKVELGDVPVPPKYKSSDFRSATFWRLRGALDVPKERFVSYPLASRDADGSLMLAWAGWDHLQQATALAAHYLDLKEQEGWPAERLMPLLAGLLELVPWLKQWHNEIDSTHGARMGDYFEAFAQDEARALGTTVGAVKAWRPTTAPARGRRRTGTRGLVQ